MIRATANSPYSFEEYLAYDDGTGNLYELVDGKLVMVPLPIVDHSDAIDLLRDTFREQIRSNEQPWIVKNDVGVYIGTYPETGKEHSRIPDFCAFTSEQWAVLKADKTSSAVLRTTPLLAVEIVSPGSKNTDYKDKQSDDELAKVPKYWIVDLHQAAVSILWLINRQYRETKYRGSQQLVSKIFPGLVLTAEQILASL